MTDSIETVPFDDFARTGEAVDDPGSATWMLVVAGACVTLSVVMFVPGENVGIHFAGYVLASLVPFTLIALFRRATTRRLFTVGVAPSPTTNVLSAAFLAVGFASTVLHAWFIARHYY